MPPLPGHVRLVVLFGGQSAEHEISCVTAAHVLRAADASRYDILPVGISREGRWLRNDDARLLLANGAAALPASLAVEGTEIDPLPVIRPEADAAGPTVVLPLLHGPRGEDGTVQGLLELAGVPYVGSGVLGSALCMDKAMAKEAAAAAGIAQCRWIAARVGVDEPEAVAARVDAELGYPAFVKPANMGSSVGITKAHDRAELLAALDLAGTFDEWLVMEEAVTAREIEVAVLGDLHPEASVPGEVVPTHEFYDYDDKYLDGAAALEIPAALTPERAAEAQHLAVRCFRALRAEGMARVDFLLEENGRGLLLNEVNTIPGFTPASMYPKLWDCSGLPYGALIDRLVELAIARHERRAGFSLKR